MTYKEKLDELEQVAKIASRALELAVEVAISDLVSKDAKNYKEIFEKHVKFYISMATHQLQNMKDDDEKQYLS